jgi:RNA recognition motif. (a.k.a. RRM, RBD, or RNP domain)
MAEGGGDLREDTKLNGGREEESVKLFVGQVPKHITEEQLIALFKEVAIVDEVNIIRDKATKASRGLYLSQFRWLWRNLSLFFFYLIVARSLFV